MQRKTVAEAYPGPSAPGGPAEQRWSDWKPCMPSVLLFAFAFALGATFSFAIFYYCLVLFVALQDTQQVIENCSELS